MASSGVRRPPGAVLWDADGVLQRGPEKVPRLLTVELPGNAGQTLADALWGEDWPAAVAGGFDMAEHVEQTIREHGLEAHREELLATWEQIEPIPEALAVLAHVRRTTPCYLATNQDTMRMRAMKQRMGYDALLDGTFYSCEVGAAKPDPAFFERVAATLRAEPADLLFVDDTLENVEAARAGGLRAEQWHESDGVDALRAALRSHGLRV